MSERLPLPPSPRLLSPWIAASAVALVLLGACIKRQPLPAAAGPAASASTAVAPVGPTAPVEPTGNWGKVKGTPLLGGIRDFKPHGQAEKLRVSTVKVEGETFTEAVHVDILQSSANAWDVQLQAKTIAPVKKGDVLLATFSFRIPSASVDGGEGDTEFVFELGQAPWTKSVSTPVRGGKDWKTVSVPFQAAGDFAAGEAQAIFRMGYAPQSVEIGGVSLESFGKELALADLPKSRPSYRGSGENAPWRAAAEARIDQTRKASLEIVVHDAAGKPVPGAQVHVELRRHAFEFGTAASAARLLDQSEPRYLQTVTDLFNAVTLEDDLEWRALAGELGKGYTEARTRAALDLLAQRGLTVRGRALVRPSWDAVPSELHALATDRPRLEAAVEKHLKQVLGAYAGRVSAWSVVESPFDQRALLEAVGRDAWPRWFTLAHASDPKAALVLDTSGALGTGPLPARQRDHAEATLKQLLAAGVPVDALGIQAGYVNLLTPPEEIVATLERLGAQGKPVIVTRFDPLIDDEELGASYLRDFYTAVFSSPAAQGVVLWGFWDGAHWKNRGPLLRHDFSAKPAGDAYRELILKRWHTTAAGPTDASGAYSTRGFLGTYQVEVVVGERTQKASVELVARGTKFDVTL